MNVKGLILIVALAVVSAACQPNAAPAAPTREPASPTTAATSSGGSAGGGGSGASSGELDASLTPNYGSSNLSSGFTPDPLTVALQSGGDVDAAALNLTAANEGGVCRGSVTSAPDYRIEWSGESENLRIFYVAADSGDTTLIVRTPGGTWLCDDDTGGSLQPQIDIATPAAGTYAIWVGSFSSGEALDGTLYVTELDYSPGNLP